MGSLLVLFSAYALANAIDTHAAKVVKTSFFMAPPS
jgi:hypothetical protein